MSSCLSTLYSPLPDYSTYLSTFSASAVSWSSILQCCGVQHVSSSPLPLPSPLPSKHPLLLIGWNSVVCFRQNHTHTYIHTHTHTHTHSSQILSHTNASQH